MKIQEYPKALYRNGAYIEVKDEAEEDAKRSEGFKDWQVDQDGDGGAAGGETGDEPAELTHADMKVKATELGLTFAHNISKAKLAELIANASQA